MDSNSKGLTSFHINNIIVLLPFYLLYLFSYYRRVLCVKEIDLIGHINKEWECQFENFLQPPYVEGGDVKIYYKVKNEEINTFTIHLLTRLYRLHRL